jgi:alpha-glucoside transport system substrate-binding protein
MRRRWLRLAAVPIAFALVATACGDDDDDDAGGDASTPVVTEGESTSTEAAGEATTPAEGTEEGGASTTPDEGTEGTEGTEAAGESATPPGGTQDFDGAEVTITGSERDDPSVIAINEALKEFGDANNITITFTGDADWESNINTQVEAGNPPNIALFPQPGKLADFVEDGYVKEVSDEVKANVDEYFDPKFSDYAVVDDALYGVPVKVDLKSLVWYKPGLFEENGWDVPETFDDFTALIETMKTDGDGRKPLCVGIESGTATGWPFTDWTEEMMLRINGPDVYDQWVSHEIPFDDPQVVDAMEQIVELWSPDNVFASGGTIAATNFGSPNAQALVDDQCYMHRQANFFGGLFPTDTAFADESNPDAIDVFYFPDMDGSHPVLTAGNFAAAFDEEPATMAVLAYMATPEYGQLRQRLQAEQTGGLSGYLSGAKGQDMSVYTPLEQGFLDILNTSEVARFDGSDQMPAVVGSGSFWSEGTSLVNGDEDAATAAANIEATWPS